MKLLRLSGLDGPGITASLLHEISTEDATVRHLGQSVLEGALALYVSLDKISPSLQTKLENLAQARGLSLSLLDLPKNSNGSSFSSARTYTLTVVSGTYGTSISAGALARVTELLASYSLNIERLTPLSSHALSCIEIRVSTPGVQFDSKPLRSQLLKLAGELGVDLGFQKETLFRRSKRLAAFDMDSTLIQEEVIDELARAHGVYEEVAKLTARAMAGELDYDESLRARVHCLKGLKMETMDQVIRSLTLTPGALETINILKLLGMKVVLISGGFLKVALHLKEKLGLDDVYSNQLVFHEGQTTGEVHTPIVNAQRKADLLDTLIQREGISKDQTLAVGDGANDILMLAQAGLGIAFHAKPRVQERASVSISGRDLRSILYFMGIPEHEFTVPRSP
jgi:phosphoserine phosphatase